MSFAVVDLPVFAYSHVSSGYEKQFAKKMHKAKMRI